jgi:hypothetical protein
MEPRYVDDPFEEEPRKKKKSGKLLGETELQKEALSATGRTSMGFRDRAQRERFKIYEAETAGTSDDSYLWHAWILHRIGEAARINTKRGVVVVSMDSLIHNISLDTKREEWLMDNKARLLDRTGEQSTQTDLDDMERRMMRRANGT